LIISFEGNVRQQSSAGESSNPPKLRRNASAASDISSTASQCGPTFPGYTLELCYLIKQV